MDGEMELDGMSVTLAQQSLPTWVAGIRATHRVIIRTHFM